MKTIYTVLLLAAFLLQKMALFAQDNIAYHNNQKLHLLSLEEQWLAAELRLDTLFIASILDSDFIGISEYGVHNKEEELIDMYNTIEQRRQNNIHIDTFKIVDGRVNFYPNTAVVTFVLHTFRNENGILTQRKTRFYDVWIKKEEKWLAVSSQGSNVHE